VRTLSKQHDLAPMSILRAVLQQVREPSGRRVIACGGGSVYWGASISQPVTLQGMSRWLQRLGSKHSLKRALQRPDQHLSAREQLQLGELWQALCAQVSPFCTCSSSVAAWPRACRCRFWVGIAQAEDIVGQLDNREQAAAATAFEQEVGALMHACHVRYRTQEQVRPAAAGAATNLTLHGLGFCVCHSHGR
jgi:hypothetical protein